MEADFTTQPVEANRGVDPEWTDIPGLKRIFSIGRSSAYTHIENGDFKSKVLRRKGCIKGKRLIFVPSVRAYIASQTDDVDPRLSELTRAAQKKSAEAKREKAGQNA